MPGGMYAVMHILSTILLGISTNLDNLLIGISFGFRKKRIGVRTNAAIGLCSALATWAACSLSSLLAGMGRTPNIIGGCLIILIGMWSLLPMGQGGGGACTAEGLTWRETAALGSCLAVNCIPVAFGAGLTGISPWAAALSVGGISVVSIATGNWLGLQTTGVWNAGLLNALGGGILILLGLLELVI